MHIYDTKPDVRSYTRNLTVDIFYTTAQDTIRHITTHALTVKCHQAIQLAQLPLMMHSEVSYNSDTELLPPYHHSTIRNQGLGLQAHNGYIGEYNCLFFEWSGTHGHQHWPRTTLVVSNIALITTTHTHTYIYIYICIKHFQFNFSLSHIEPDHCAFYHSFFSIKDTLTTPSEQNTLLTYQHHKGNPTSTQQTCGGGCNLEWPHGHNSRPL